MIRLLSAIAVMLSVLVSNAYGQHGPGGPGGKLEMHVGLDLTPGGPGFSNNLPAVFNWTVTNNGLINATGQLRAKLDNKVVAVQSPNITALAPKARVTGNITLAPLPPGPHVMTLEFLVPRNFGNIVVGIPIATVPLNFTVTNFDVDNDGLDDQFEHAVLERYRPFFKFSKPKLHDKIAEGRLPNDDSEPYPPIEFADYMKFSQVVRTPDNTALCGNCQVLLQPNTFAGGDLSGVLNVSVNAADTCTSDNGTPHCLSDITQNARKTRYAFHPVNMPTFEQPDMDHAVQVGNMGLYGHVVPYTQNTPQDDVSSQGKIRTYFAANDPRRLRRLIKVEYWQFFPKNGGVVPHQADWDTVQLLIDLDSPSLSPCQNGLQRGLGLILMVMHYHHGDESRFDFGQCAGSTPAAGLPGITEFRGADGTSKVQLFQDASGNLTHPVVYIEYATHEFWPTTEGSETLTPNHNGDGTSFLTAAPPNLGEVESPLNEYAHAKELMRFNGYWGACCIVNWSPPGPALHTEWTWPASSSVGYLVKDQAER
jgi:hypothetical protein